MSNIDNVVPKEKWVFDDSVADCFENMLERSIPQYSVMRTSIVNLVKNWLLTDSKGVLKSNIELLDIGCSDGLMIQEFISNLSDFNIRYTGVDVSEPMLSKAKYRFLDDILNRKVSIQNCDLRTDYPNGVFDVVTSILSIQFIPIEYRQHIIQNIFNSLSKFKGCFIMVEKVLGNTDEINQLMVKNYYELKLKNGYSQLDIDRKRLSLEGVLVPVTNDWNIELLKSAGFTQVDVFWRWMNFVGYIAVK